MSEALVGKGEKLLYEFVYRPVRGIVVDYKIQGKTLILIIEKENRELIEGPFDVKLGKGRPKGSKNKPNPRKNLVCPVCKTNKKLKFLRGANLGSVLCTNHVFDQFFMEEELIAT